MAAMAAGFSPHASLAAAYGLPEGTTPYGSHPLLQVTVCYHGIRRAICHALGYALEMVSISRYSWV
jgi:hypothetical protein